MNQKRFHDEILLQPFIRLVKLTLKMVILRQERVFSYAGKVSLKVLSCDTSVKGKFSECWMIIVYDTSGPSIHLYKDPSAKKAIYDR